MIMVPPDFKAAHAFLNAVCEPAMGGDSLLGIACGKWLSNGKLGPLKQDWFTLTPQGITAAAQTAIEKTLAGYEVYFTCSLFKGQSGRPRRCKENAACFCTLWADLDFAECKAETAKHYPTENAVFQFLHKLPLPPSVVVMSGRGCHAYWFLDAPADASIHLGLVHKWQAFLQCELHFDLDSTGDLSRVLRVPGTFNQRAGQGANRTRVTLREFNPTRRYSLAQILGLVGQANVEQPTRHSSKHAPPKRTPAKVNRAVLRLTDEDKRIMRNTRISEKCDLLWKGDWKAGYSSQSEADLALCAHLAFRTQCNAAQIDRIFRRSGLFRPKWDERRGANGETYGEMTIKKACSNQPSKLGRVRKATEMGKHLDSGWVPRLSHLAFKLYSILVKLEEDKRVGAGGRLFAGFRELAKAVHASPNSIRATLEELARYGLIEFKIGTKDKRERHATEIRRILPIPKLNQGNAVSTNPPALSLNDDRAVEPANDPRCHFPVIHLNTAREVYISKTASKGRIAPITPDPPGCVIALLPTSHHSLREDHEGWIEEVRYAFE